MLPPASAKALRMSKNIKNLQTAATAAPIKADPLQSYISLIGPGAARESATSKAFRGQIISQAAPTMRPQAAKVVSEAATVPPPRRATL